MSRNQIVALAVIAVVLAVVFIAQRAAEPEPDIERELALERLAPEEFLASDVSMLELYRGSEKDEKVVLTRGGDGWTVETPFKAPGKAEKIDEFLKKMKDLEGEYRSDEASVLEDYQLADDRALHAAAFREGEDVPWCHLLVGKKETYGGSFIRRADEDTVYTVDVNLASEAGLWDNDPEKKPESSDWVDKTVVDLDKEKVERIAIVTPDRSFVLEKREKKDESGTEEEKEGKDEKEEKNKKKDYEWVLAEGGPGVELKKSGVDDILKALDSFSASDVVDPAKKKDYGLDKPGFRCAVGLKGGKEKVMVAAREKPGETGYLMLEGRDVVYKVDDWKFDDVFPDAKDLFDLKGLDEDKDKVRRIVLNYPSARLELASEGEKNEKWKVVSPETGLELDESEAKDLAEDLAGWKPDDYADGEDLEALGLSEPGRKVTFVMDDGKEHTIAIGAEAKVIEGRYALLDGGKRVWIAGKSDIENILPEPKDLFELEVADIEKEDIVKIAVESKDAAFVLDRKGQKREKGEEDEKDKDWWRLTSAGTELAPDEEKLERYLERFEAVKVSDVALGRSAAWEPSATVTVEAKEGKRFRVAFGPEKDDKREARVEGRRALLLFSSYDVEKLVASLKDLADLTVADVPAEEITKVAVEREADAFELIKKGDAWKLTAGGEETPPRPCDAAAVRKYLGRFSGLEADDVSVGSAELVPDDSKPVVTVTKKDGSELSIVVGKEHDGKVAVTKKDSSLVYLIGKDDASSLAPPSADLAEKKEKKEGDEEEDEEKEGEEKEPEEKEPEKKPDPGSSDGLSR